MKSTFKIKIILLTFSLLIVGITTWQLVRAQTEAPFGGNPGDDNYSPTEQGLTETGSSNPDDYDFNDYTQGGGLTEGNKQGELEKSRQKASEQCQAESNGLGGIAKQAGSLAQTISQALANSFNRTVNNLLGEKIPSIIQNQLSNKLPNLIQNSLRQKVPSLVNSRVNQMQGLGMSESSIRSAIPQLITQAIQQVATQTIREQTPKVIEEGLRDELPPEMVEQFNAQIPEIIQNSQFAGQVSEMVASTSQQLSAETIVGLQMSSGQQTDLTNNLIDGSITAAQNGINNSSAVVDLSNQVSASITNQIVPILLNNLMPQINSLFSGGGSGSGGSIGGLVNSGLNLGGLQLTGANFDLSQGLSGDFFNPISQAMAPALADEAAFGIAQLQGPAGIQRYVDNVIARTDAVGTSAAGAVSNASGAIAQGGVKGINWGGIGTNIQTGLVTGLSSGLGGLAGNIPFVGGLVSPIVEQVVQQAMIQALGLPVIPIAGVAMMLVYDPGGAQTNANATAQNAKAVTKAIGEVQKVDSKIESNTKAIDDTTKKIESLAQQTCTLEKRAENELENLNRKFFKDDPDAWDASMWALLQANYYNTKYFNTSFKVSPGVTGVASNPDNQSGEGQSVIADLPSNIKNAEKEKENQTVTLTQEKNSGNIHGDKVAQAYQQMTGSSYADQIKSTMTKDQFDSLSDPAKLATMSDEEYWDALLGSLEPQNNVDGTFMLLDSKTATEKAAAKELAIAQYNANQGYNDTRECVSGYTDANGGKWCWEWRTLTPGSTNKAVQEETLLSPYKKAQYADSIGENANNQVLGTPLYNIIDLTKAPTNYQSEAGSDPCPGTDPCPNSGWKPNQVTSLSTAFNSGLTTGLNNVGNTLGNWANSTIDNFTNNAFNFDSYGGGYSSGSGNYSGGGSNSFVDIVSLLSNIQIPAPEINYFRLATNGSTLEWSTNNSLACVATNDWVGTEYVADNPLPGIQGSVNLNLPATHAQLSYEIRCLGFGINDAVVETVTVPAK